MKEMGRFKDDEILDDIFVFVKVEHSDGFQFGNILALGNKREDKNVKYINRIYANLIVTVVCGMVS